MTLEWDHGMTTELHSLDHEIIGRYTDQPARLPAALRRHIEASWNGAPVQLYALADLDDGLRLTEAWVALGPGHLTVARATDGPHEWDLMHIGRGRVGPGPPHAAAGGGRPARWGPHPPRAPPHRSRARGPRALREHAYDPRPPRRSGARRAALQPSPATGLRESDVRARGSARGAYGRDGRRGCRVRGERGAADSRRPSAGGGAPGSGDSS